MTTTLREPRRLITGTGLLVATLAGVAITVDAWVAGITSVMHGSDPLRGAATGMLVVAFLGTGLVSGLAWATIRALSPRPAAITLRTDRRA
jgi:hypothetical protein